jgi:hypothetical protein
MVCRRCGVYIAAVCETTGGTRAVVNVNCLTDRAAFTPVPAVSEYEGETIGRLRVEEDDLRRIAHCEIVVFEIEHGRYAIGPIAGFTVRRRLDILGGR